MVYLLGWGVMFISAPLQYVKGGRFFGALSILYCAFLAIFRGDVGTDTAAYIEIFEKTLHGGEAPYGEPGFLWLSKFFLYFSHDAEVAVKLVSLFFFFVLFIVFIRCNKDGRFFIVAFFLPGYAYLYSMNALRIGVASVILFYAIQKLEKREVLKSVFGMLAAVSLHFSAILLMTFMLVFSKKIWRIKYFFFYIFLVVMLLFFIFINFEYLYGKFFLYKNFEVESGFSGLRVVLVTFCLMLGFAFCDLPSDEIIFNLIVLTFIITFLFIMTRVSYAGLRVLEIAAISWPVAIVIAHKKNGVNFNFYMRAGFLIAGFVYATLIYIGFLKEAGEGITPFLPYKFSF